MRKVYGILIVCLGLTAVAVASDLSNWSLDQIDEAIIIHGPTKIGEGVSGQSIVLDGRALLELAGSAELNPGEAGFTVSVWFSPYRLRGGQQMVMGKNRYSLGDRQWGIMIEPDGQLRAYLRQEGWKTISCDQALLPGHWHQAVLTVSSDHAMLFLNGEEVGAIPLAKPISATEASITLGGIRDGNRNRQQFAGALDEVRFEPRVVSAEEISARYEPVSVTHEIPEPPKRFALWDESVELPKAEDLPELKQGPWEARPKNKWMKKYNNDSHDAHWRDTPSHM